MNILHKGFLNGNKMSARISRSLSSIVQLRVCPRWLSSQRRGYIGVAHPPNISQHLCQNTHTNVFTRNHIYFHTRNIISDIFQSDDESETNGDKDHNDQVQKRNHKRPPLILGSASLTQFKDRCFESDIEMSLSDWQDFKDTVLTENPFCEKALEATCFQLMYAARNLKLAESFMEFIRSTGKSPNRASLVTYMSLCAVFGKKDKQDVIFECYDEMRKVSELFDSTSIKHLILAFSHTDEWRKCFDFIEMAKLTDNPTSAIYSPIVRAALREKDTKVVHDLLAQMADAGIEPSKDVLQDYVKSIGCVGSETSLETLMDMLQTYNWSICEETVKLLAEYFKSSTGKKYKSKLTTVNNSGVCQACKHHLRRLDMSDAEFETLQRDLLENVLIGDNTYEQSSPGEIERFKHFVMENAPFDIVLDALNVAYRTVARNPSRGPNSFFLRKVVEHFGRFQRQRVLVLGKQHMKSWPPQDMAVIDRWAKSFYTDNSSKDDPFALYAAIYSGKSCMIMSGDHMRDHKFRLGPHLKESFEQWQRTHQITHCIPQGKGVFVEMPPKHDTRPQQDERGWHIPYEDQTDRAVYERPDTWLCVREVKPRKSGKS